MLTAAEIARSVYGVWRLAHVDAGGMRYLDATPDGFWRSFRVAVLLLPAYVLLLWIQYAGPRPDGSQADVAGSVLHVAAIELIAYAIGWIAFPLAAHYLVTALDREREYVAYIVAFNWSAVLQMGVFLPIAAIRAWSLLPAPLDGILFIAVLAALLAYSWFIARTALRIGALPATGFVALDVLLAVLISVTKDSMIY